MEGGSVRPCRQPIFFNVACSCVFWGGWLPRLSSDDACLRTAPVLTAGRVFLFLPFPATIPLSAVVLRAAHVNDAAKKNVGDEAAYISWGSGMVCFEDT